MRFLTKKEKTKELIFLKERYKKASLKPDGHLDLEIIPYLERINVCDGMVTLQSCTGHKKSVIRNYTCDGHLWVRLNKELTILFNQKLIILVKSKLINQVDKMYSFFKEKELHEVINIPFKGHESDSFHQSMEFITQFFERLNRR